MVVLESARRGARARDTYITILFDSKNNRLYKKIGFRFGCNSRDMSTLHLAEIFGCKLFETDCQCDSRC